MKAIILTFKEKIFDFTACQSLDNLIAEIRFFASYCVF